MMKILFTESSSDIGGQELQALAQMTALQKQGHSVLLACREKSKIAPEARKRGMMSLLFLSGTAFTFLPSSDFDGLSGNLNLIWSSAIVAMTVI
ncbi:hypothetical protein H6S22_29325 (plasmid) [Escherichia coli]|nr:hypothetical protein H6S22_29325 [Escherichia coli]